jgi:F-type H+-transporting ATPase subunit a
MINNLFSIFDPAAIFLLSFNWLRIAIFIIIFLPSFWVLSSPYKNFIKKVSLAIIKEFSVLLKNKKINIIVFIALFMLIVFNNTLGLISFTFTATRHLRITLSLALPM